MTSAQTEAADESLKLFTLLQTLKSEIMTDWEKAVVRNLPKACQLPRPLLIDNIPELLDQIGWLADALLEGRSVPVPQQPADAHAFVRLEVGFDLGEVVDEYAVLRATILQHLWAQQILPKHPEMSRALNRAIDVAVGVSVEQYTRAKDRALAALDRVATASFESKNLDELLNRLLGVFLDAAPAVQTTAVFLREGDNLRLRAASGMDLEAEVAAHFTVAMGEGFAGTIAAERRAIFLEKAAKNLLLKSPVLRTKGVRALYGVALVDDRGELIGVMHMGSFTDKEFSAQDKQLFEVLASRATILVVQHLLRDNVAAEQARLVSVLEQQKRLLAEIDIERKRFIGLVNNLDRAVVWEANAETLQFSFVSDIAHVVTGYSPDEWKSASQFWREHVPVEDQDALFATFERCRSGGTDCRCNHRLIRRDGSIAWVCTGIHAVQRKGVLTFHGISTDITDLQDALRVREQILGLVSHDLRNPLNSIVLSARALEQVASGAGGAMQTVIQRQADVILRAANHMSRMVADLLDQDALAAKRLAMKLEYEDPGELIRESVHAFEDVASAKQVVLEISVPEKLPAIYADRGRVLQILSNLIGNAVKATEGAGSIVVRAQRESGEVLFTVADTGRGIPVEDLPRIFEPYWRGDDFAYAGSGLGLVITRALVLAHGGRIWVESRFGTGTTFFFTLPMMHST